MPKQNAEWNKSQPPGSPPIDTKWEKPEFIAVKCNIHPWMHGYFVVLKTSRYGITGDDGTFTIKDVPPGQVHANRLAGAHGHPDAGGYGLWRGATANFTFKAMPY